MATEKGHGKISFVLNLPLQFVEQHLWCGVSGVVTRPNSSRGTSVEERSTLIPTANRVLLERGWPSCDHWHRDAPGAKCGDEVVPRGSTGHQDVGTHVRVRWFEAGVAYAWGDTNDDSGSRR